MPRQSTNTTTRSPTRSNSSGNNGRKLAGSNNGGSQKHYIPTRGGAGQHSRLSKSR